MDHYLRQLKYLEANNSNIVGHPTKQIPIQSQPIKQILGGIDNYLNVPKLVKANHSKLWIHCKLMYSTKWLQSFAISLESFEALNEPTIYNDMKNE